MSRVGSLPRDLGVIDLNPSEMMFWMYLPISTPSSYDFCLPDNLKQFEPIVAAVRDDCISGFFLRYVYLTAKTLFVSGDYIGNRPGWHIDGYGTDDLNYVWADRLSTDFFAADSVLSDDCNISLAQMDDLGSRAEERDEIVTYPEKSLLRLDNTVIHRSPVGFKAGMRTFVKVSLSNDRYNLLGNSVNHLLPSTQWPLVEREVERNHPAKAA